MLFSELFVVNFSKFCFHPEQCVVLNEVQVNHVFPFSPVIQLVGLTACSVLSCLREREEKMINRKKKKYVLQEEKISIILTFGYLCVTATAELWRLRDRSLCLTCGTHRRRTQIRRKTSPWQDRSCSAPMGGKLWGCCFVICLLVLPAARALVLHSCGFVHGCHSPLYLLNNEVISTVSWFHSFVKLVVQRGNPCLSNSLTPGSDWHSHSNFIVGKKSLHYPNISTLRRSVRSPMTRQQGFNLWGVQSSPPRRRAAQEGSSTCTPAELPGEEEIRSSPSSRQTQMYTLWADLWK